MGVVACAAALLATSCSSTTDEGATRATTDGSAPGPTVNITDEADAGPPASGGSLSFGLAAETDGWSPWHNRFAGSGYIVGNAIYDPLFAYDTEGHPQPYLAEKAEPNGDFTEWKITVRSGVKFHDGEPLDALVVKRNFEAGLESPLVGAALQNIESVDGSAGSMTATVKMKSSWSSFPHTLTAQLGYLQSPKLMDDPKGDAAVRRPVGTGPFKFADWVPDKSLKVVRNDNYWRKDHPVYLDGIDFQVLPDFQARGQSLESGTIDVMETSDPEQIIKFRTKAEAKEYQMFTDAAVDGSETFIALNTAKAPFDDPLARQIVAYGIDTNLLSQQAYQGEFPSANGPYTKESPFYAETNYPKFSIAKAMELHEQYKAKHGKPLAFTSIVPPAPEYQQIAQSLKAQAAEYGVEVTIDSKDQTSLILAVLTGNYEASGFILFGSPSLDREYSFIASKPNEIGQTSLNFTRLDDPILTQAMDDARKVSDDDIDAKKKSFKTVQERMAENLNFIFLVHQRTAIVYDNRAHGLSKPTLPGGKPGLLTVQPFTYEVWVKR